MWLLQKQWRWYDEDTTTIYGDDDDDDDDDDETATDYDDTPRWLLHLQWWRYDKDVVTISLLNQRCRDTMRIVDERRVGAME